MRKLSIEEITEIGRKKREAIEHMRALLDGTPAPRTGELEVANIADDEESECGIYITNERMPDGTLIADGISPAFATIFRAA